MSIATQDQPTKAHSAAVDMPEPLDPEHDIDAKSATWWVLGGTVVLFLSLWVMLPIFMRVQEEERIRKVDTTPNTELDEVLAEQNAFLHEKANPTRKTLEQAMAEALRK
ncbi:MAG: hypothetical protein KDE27_21800 [Planctomycetes bacterium]|nr:hypothetical protein [Planctomycetota bacterium]